MASEKNEPDKLTKEDRKILRKSLEKHAKTHVKTLAAGGTANIPDAQLILSYLVLDETEQLGRLTVGLIWLTVFLISLTAGLIYLTNVLIAKT